MPSMSLNLNIALMYAVKNSQPITTIEVSQAVKPIRKAVHDGAILMRCIIYRIRVKPEQAPPSTVPI